MGPSLSLFFALFFYVTGAVIFFKALRQITGATSAYSKIYRFTEKESDREKIYLKLNPLQKFVLLLKSSALFVFSGIFFLPFGKKPLFLAFAIAFLAIFLVWQEKRYLKSLRKN